VKWLVGTFAAIASLFAALFFRNKSNQQKEHLRTLIHNKEVALKSEESARPLDFAEVKEVEDHVEAHIENHDYTGAIDPRKLRNKNGI